MLDRYGAQMQTSPLKFMPQCKSSLSANQLMEQMRLNFRRRKHRLNANSSRDTYSNQNNNILTPDKYCRLIFTRPPYLNTYYLDFFNTWTKYWIYLPELRITCVISSYCYRQPLNLDCRLSRSVNVM